MKARGWRRRESSTETLSPSPSPAWRERGVIRLFEFGLVAFFVAVFLLARSLAVSAADADAAQAPVAETQQAAPAGDDFDFFSDQPVESAAVVELPPEKPLRRPVRGLRGLGR